MKKELGWWFPDGEKHLPAWMSSAKGYLVINGRPSYQGKKQLAAIAECGRAKRTRTAIDVGAHIGLWSFNLAHAFTRTVAFEPVAAHRDCFRLNCAEQLQAGKIELHACALGIEESLVSIKTAPTSSGDSRVSGAGDIQMRTLDSFELADVDFIKVDCEGFEEYVLRGGAKLIDLHRPIVMVEQKRDMAEAHFGLPKLGAVNFLLERGYVVAAELSGDYLMVPR